MTGRLLARRARLLEELKTVNAQIGIAHAGLTVAETARRLEVSPQRVRAMIANGQIPADKHGRDWAIREPLIDPRKPRGRPAKAAKP